MLSQPGVPKRLRIGLQRVVREGVLRSSRSKEARTLGVVAGEGPRPLEGFGLAREEHPRACLAQAGVVDLPRRFQTREQRVLIVRAHPQRDLTHKGGGPFGALVSGSALGRHGFLVLANLGQSF